jgi:hypothetical protein
MEVYTTLCAAIIREAMCFVKPNIGSIAPQQIRLTLLPKLLQDQLFRMRIAFYLNTPHHSEPGMID